MQVGDDEFGHMLVDVLRENGVETRGCRFDANARTALAFVTLRHDGRGNFCSIGTPVQTCCLSLRNLIQSSLERYLIHLPHTPLTAYLHNLSVLPCSVCPNIHIPLNVFNRLFSSQTLHLVLWQEIRYIRKNCMHGPFCMNTEFDLMTMKNVHLMAGWNLPLWVNQFDY